MSIKKKPYPSTLPPMPKGQVYLGPGGTFKVPRGGFDGYRISRVANTWLYESRWSGDSDGSHYCAPADSEVARLNGLAPAKKAPRKAAKKTKSIMSGFSEDVKTTPTLVLEVGKTYLTRANMEVKVIAVIDNTYPIVGVMQSAVCQTVYQWREDGIAYDEGTQHQNDIISLAPDFDWSCLPPWINYIALDSDGDWEGYEIKPKASTHYWGAECEFKVQIPPQYAPTSTPSDWRQSLRVRPGYQPE